MHINIGSKKFSFSSIRHFVFYKKPNHGSRKYNAFKFGPHIIYVNFYKFTKSKDFMLYYIQNGDLL